VNGDVPRRRRFRGRLVVAAFRTGSALARALPEPAVRPVAAVAGAAVALFARDRRPLVERHLRRAAPELGGGALRRASRRSFQSYARYYVETFRVPHLSAQAVDRRFHVEGLEPVTKAVASGQGVILALPHLGGWEWAGRWLIEQGYPMAVVVETLEPPELFTWFRSLRERLGMRVLALGESSATDAIAELRAGHVLCLLCDRDIEGTGVEVELLGERTTIPSGPAVLGLRTGAPIVPVAVYFTAAPGGHHAVCLPPVDTARTGTFRNDVAATSQRLADSLSELIRRAPEQWHLQQPNWPSDPGFRA
jgi:KDO2-lipid IV(A) lauroyltransferase